MGRITTVVTKRSLATRDTSWADYWRCCAGFISLEGLIANETASARPRDLVDIEMPRDLE